jgi:hypothetical protein
MMWRFASFAVPRTQQSEYSEFIFKNSVSNCYLGNIHPARQVLANPASAAKRHAARGYSLGAPAIRAAKAAAWERRCMPSLASSEDT